MKTLVIITSYNRKDSLQNLLMVLRTVSDADIVIFDDQSPELPKFDKFGNVTCIINPEHRGKAGFWKTYNDIFVYCKEHWYDYYIILPDDVEPCPDFVNKAIAAYQGANCISLSPLLTNRSILAGISRWGQRRIIAYNEYYETNYFDCCGVVRRDFFEALNWQMAPIVPSANPFMSSGVGRQITVRLQRLGKRMGHVKRTLLATTENHSQMNAKERRRHPMYADWRDNKDCVDVHMASLWRDGHVVVTAESLLRQPELKDLYVTLNNYTDEQYEKVCKAFDILFIKYGKRVITRRCKNRKGSNEKLGMLTRGEGKYIAFADDDIIYPADYLMRLIHGCNIHDAAVSLHGGILKRFPIKKYYNGDRSMKSWNSTLENDVQVDMMGTGVGLMRREWFSNEELRRLYATAPTVSMDDIIVSCWLAQKGIDRWVLEHQSKCISIKKPIASDDYVYDRYKDDDSVQVAYINEHYPAAALVNQRK